MPVAVYIAFLSALIIALNAAPADVLAGSWKANWTKDGDALPVTVRFAKTANAYSGAFDSDALQVAGIPLGDESDHQGRVHFQIKGDQSTTVFDDAIAGEIGSGTFTDGSSS